MRNGCPRQDSKERLKNNYSFSMPLTLPSPRWGEGTCRSYFCVIPQSVSVRTLNHAGDAHHWLRKITAAIAIALFLGCHVATSASPPAQEESEANSAKPRETWDAVFVGGAKVGSIHTVYETHSDRDPPLREIRSLSKLVMSRYGQTVELQTDVTCLETLDGEVKSFTTRTVAGPSPIIVEGQRCNGTMQLVTTSQQKKTTSQIDWHPSNRGFFAAEQSLRDKPMQPGEQRSINMLFAGLTGVQVVQTTLEARQWELVRLLHTHRRCLKVRQLLHLGEFVIEANAWLDSMGEVQKMSMPSLNHATYRTTRERAMSKDEGGHFDLGWDTIVRLDTPLRESHALRRAVYEATMKHADPHDLFSTGTSQQTKSIDAHTAQITVVAIRPDSPQVIVQEAPPAAADRGSSNLIQTDDPVIVKMAKDVAQGESDPWQISTRLETWVHMSMRAKNTGQGFATAADVARNFEGDCTEHAVLLTALCRACNIPARVAIGLVYSPSDQGFAFHMWNEAWIRDRWIPLDATRGNGGIGATHLKLTHSSLSQDTAETAVLSVLQVINQVELKVLEVEK
jgi:hypothetical protein